MHKVRDVSSETAKAWKWIQENQGEFEQEVYGPPLISCSVKDPRYTDIIESLLTKNDFMTITAQTRSDFNKLNNQLYGTMKLADVTLRTSYDSLDSYPRSLPAHEMDRCGLEGWALDFIDGPEPVLAMLCDSAKIHYAGVSLRDITEDQFNILVQSNVTLGLLGDITTESIRAKNTDLMLPQPLQETSCLHECGLTARWMVREDTR